MIKIWVWPLDNFFVEIFGYFTQKKLLLHTIFNWEMALGVTKLPTYTLLHMERLTPPQL